MLRRTFAAACLAVITLSAGALPGAIAPVAAATCSNWVSESVPPPTIRVFRSASATGAVDTVDFKTYAKNVLSREWIGSWTTESLRSGALAVRNYAWYYVLHWRGGVNADGACFDVRDDTQDQVYDPSKPTWSTAAAAVDDTWSWLVTKAGHIFPTYYNAGTQGEACGANRNGWKAYQWGTQACGLAGETAAQIILTYYYPGVTVSGAPGISPTPTPTQTPSPTPAITPSPSAAPSASPSASTAPSATPQPSPTPTSTPTPSPTATPTARPTATPAALPTPPAAQQLPGGGQATVSHASAPPPAPPAHPNPVVATPALPPGLDALPPGAYLTRLPGPVVLYGVVTTGGQMDTLAPPPDASPQALPDARLSWFRELFPRVAAQLLRSIAVRLASRDTWAMALLR
ncbi:MAG TPA: SpoIID/LytB domain-containing protein [Candidatus Limnocylindria bacterium]|nr:SpoIID/LytB domain-containing protein [Candidatus Limnocylindria bacterium]